MSTRNSRPTKMNREEKLAKAEQGLKEFHGPEQSDGTVQRREIDYDVVAVPGLGTDPIHCWAGSKPDTGPGQRAAADDGDGNTEDPFNWLTSAEGLHAKFPRGRIMIFQYLSAWQGDLRVRGDFKGIAKHLLASLNSMRENITDRPIIFIGHSMGGLVIAKALCLADGEPGQYADILMSTTSCIFFGTPFYGAKFAQLYITYNILYRLGNEEADDYTGLLKFLTPDSIALIELSLNFKALAKRMQPQIMTFCFYELAEFDWTTHIKGFLEKLNRPGAMEIPSGAEKSVTQLQKTGKAYFVTKESAVLDGDSQYAYGLQLSHRDLVRFESPTDQTYRAFIQLIWPCFVGAVGIFRDRSKQRPVDRFQLIRVRNLLASETVMSVKLRNLSKTTTADTWLATQAIFERWLRQCDESQPQGKIPKCLCIEGPPGYGKTAASVAAVKHIEAEIMSGHEFQRNELTLCTYFFCDEKPNCSTAEDVLKSLLLQIIGHAPELAKFAAGFAPEERSSSSSAGSAPPQKDQMLTQSTNRSAAPAGKRNGPRPHKEARATLTIEHMWQCLMDILESPLLHAVYIVINNIHRLAQNESFSKFLDLLGSEVTSRQPEELPNHYGRWFFTTSSDGRLDLPQCLGSEAPNLCLMDLKNSEYKKLVKTAVTQHVAVETQGLRTSKGYDDGLAFEVEKIIASKAENKRWVDIICLQLGTLPERSPRLLVKGRLEAAARGNLRQLMADTWHWRLGQMGDPDKSKVREVLKTIVLLKEDVTIEELSVLTEFGSAELKSLIGACAPMLSFSNDHQRVTFANIDIQQFLCSEWSKILSASDSDRKEGDAVKEQDWQHGYLAWKCFSHIRERLSSDLDVLSDDDASSSDGIINTAHSSSSYAPPLCRYALKNWKYHVSKGGAHISQSLIVHMSQFWEPHSVLRARWLRHYVKLESDFDDVDIRNLTALHVTSALGLKDLSSSLIKSEDKEQLESVNLDGYTPLHLAAYNNHTDMVELLLSKPATINPSERIASPLHLAAVRGHVAVMRQLLNRPSSPVSNPNALCDSYGPVINAAIQSGVSEAVKELLRLELSFDSSVEPPPLVLSAMISKPALFKDILEAGARIWTTDHYEEALYEACYYGRTESVKALLEAYKSRNEPWDRDCIEDSLVTAGYEDNWEIVNSLLELHPELDYGDIFYLAATATTLSDSHQTLKRIWKLAKCNISNRIKNAALYQASDNEKTPTVKWLLENCKANPNAIADKPDELSYECIERYPGDRYGDALTAAAYDGNIDLIEVLLSHNADVNSPHGAALQTAARQGNEKAVTILLDNKAKINHVLSRELMEELKMEYLSGTALQAACDYRRPNVVKILLDRGANPNLGHEDSRYTCPILSATCNNQPLILAHLLEAKDIVFDIQGGPTLSNPFQTACAYMDLVDVQKLLKKSADIINAADQNGDQAIHKAAAAGNATVIKFLLDENSQVTHRNKRGRLAIQEALSNGNIECAALLADAIAPGLDALADAGRMSDLPETRRVPPMDKGNDAPPDKFSSPNIAKLQVQLAEEKDASNQRLLDLVKAHEDHLADLRKSRGETERERKRADALQIQVDRLHRLLDHTPALSDAGTRSDSECRPSIALSRQTLTESFVAKPVPKTGPQNEDHNPPIRPEEPKPMPSPSPEPPNRKPTEKSQKNPKKPKSKPSVGIFGGILGNELEGVAQEMRGSFKGKFKSLSDGTKGRFRQVVRETQREVQNALTDTPGGDGDDASQTNDVEAASTSDTKSTVAEEEPWWQRAISE